MPSALPAGVVEEPYVVVIDEIRDLVAGPAGLDPVALRVAAAEHGLTALDLSSSAILTDAEMGHVYEAVGAIDADLREVFGAGHARLIDRFGSEAAIERWLPGVREGSLIGVAVTEPGGGSDLGALRVRAERVPAGWIVNGIKGPMARITEAAAFVVFAMTEKGLTALVVDADAEGLERHVAEVSGLSGWSFGELSLDNVFAPESAVLGGVGDGRLVFKAHFAEWRAFMGCVAIGAGQAALEQARQWALERQVERRPLAHQPSIEERFGQHKLALDLSRLAAQQALAAPVRLRPDLAVAAKVAATDAGYAAVEFAIGVFGARGLMPSVGLEKRARDLRALKIADGANDVLTSHLGRVYLRASERTA